MVPSDARRSRFCSVAVMRLITGATRSMTRLCTAGWANASRWKSSASTIATRQSVSACILTPSGPPVRTLIAPIQVGASWRPDGSVRPPSTSSV